MRRKDPSCEEVEREARKYVIAEAILVGVAWFKNGLFWVTQTIRILPPGKGGFDTAMKKPGSVSNPFRVQLKGAETA
jgi:hypothetical protein